VGTTPDAARHRRCKELLLEALELPEGEREAFLRERCAGDDALLADALSLLVRCADLGGFLEAPVPGAAVCPERLGEFRIRRLLGRGGMGIVYLAEQPGLEREVALKVLRIDAATAAVRARFAREAAVLGRFRHPGIARVYAATVVETDAGPQPAICMEYVDGLQVTEHARAARLGVRAVLELVLQVADAVEHAHAAGVLHRDLKPDNVLVERSGRVCVLDFGIAQVAAEEADSFVTRTGQVLGTVAYMSPEQARGGRVDERTDLFSLGVILYELLTGELPFETRGALVHEALRTLAEEDHVPLSRRDTALRGDLDTILSTALASEPARRYRSVAELSADLRAYLAGRPISARPPSSLYVVSRFVRRNRPAALALVLVCLSLGGGAVVALQALTRAEEQSGLTELFADRNLLDELAREAEALWPADSTRLAEIEAWLARAAPLAARLGAHRARVLEVERNGVPASQGAAVEAGWLLSVGHDLVADVERFLAADGLRAEMRARRDRAAALRRVTVDEQRAAWDAARARVAADPRFAGFELAPQEGLVPLGPDPRSGLEELAHHGVTGAIPRRDARTGELVLTDESAVVLVLVPGGTVSIGDPREPFNGRRTQLIGGVEREVMRNSGPSCEVRLDPYLISKFELTQGQFERAFGFNPSDHGVGDLWQGQVIGPRNPVESLSWELAIRLLTRLGMELPTEAQWEAAARAGTEGPWIFGPTAQSLVGYANLGYGSDEGSGAVPPRDGHLSHAPVGTFGPNAYGLHDVIGNVWELCRDVYKVRYHSLEHRGGDGLVLAEPDGDVTRRGHGRLSEPASARVWTRGDRRLDSPEPDSGLRPAWTLR
jgi:serine/threonine-protein kinase